MTLATYTTLAAVKARLDRTDAKDDAALTAIIEAASRYIDSYCNRTFAQSSETRVFTTRSSYLCDVDDLVSVTTIKTDVDGDRQYETTWAVTDFDLEPLNAAPKGDPYTSIGVAPMGRYAFPTHNRGVQITAVWGWPSVPVAVAEATVLMTLRLFQRKNAPYGIAGSTELGQPVLIGRTDPDVSALLAPYRRYALGAL